MKEYITHYIVELQKKKNAFAKRDILWMSALVCSLFIMVTKLINKILITFP